VTVAASALGFQPFERTVTIQAGVMMPLVISLVPIAPTPAPATQAVPAAPAAASPPAAHVVSNPPAAATETRTTGGWHTWTGISLMAAGAAALGLGITWIAIDGDCPSGEVCPPDPHPTSGLYRTRTPGWIVTGVGAAALAGGVAIFFTRGCSSSSNVSLGLTPTSLRLETRF